MKRSFASSSITRVPCSLPRRSASGWPGNTFYGKERLFSPDFLTWLSEYRLPEYDLRVEDGQFRIDFSGTWAAVTLWEIPVLSIISELRSRAAMKGIGRFELDVLYARAKAKLWAKVVRLDALPELRIADFGTRRRHSYLWHRWCVEAMKEGLGEKFTGTSNVLHAMELDIEAIGTNAHELPWYEQRWPAMTGSCCEPRTACSKVGNVLMRETFSSCCPIRSEPPPFCATHRIG